MLTNNPNRKPNHRNTLVSRALRLFHPLLVSFSAFFSNNAPSPLSSPQSMKKVAGKTPWALLRIYRKNPHGRLYISLNTLRLIAMWLLAFLVSFLTALQIILTTRMKA